VAESYAYDHGWNEERIRLAGLEAALDPGTQEHLLRLGLAPGTRLLEVGAGGGSVAFWAAERVAPTGMVVEIDVWRHRPGGGRCPERRPPVERRSLVRWLGRART
jgi:ubiquinone/menaquinone biosynthesis C-methylase UbiE